MCSWGCRVTEYTGRQIMAIRGPRLTSIILCSPTRSCWRSVLRTITSLLELLMVFTNQPTAARHFKGLWTNIGVTAYSITASGGNVVAAVNVSFNPSSGLAGIFYSSDNGGTWHQGTLPITPTAVTAVASDGSSLAYDGVFGQSSSVKGLYKSTDAGVTWTQRQALNVDIERLAANGNNVLAGDLFGAYYSLDFGESWTFSDPPGNCPFGCGIFTYTFRGSSIFAGDEVGMFFSTD